jgi:hypothetical protein
MKRFTILVFAMAMSVAVAQSVRADFLIGTQGFPQLVHNNGTTALTLTGGPFFSHESYDTFVLSADAQRIYLFANDLGGITAESWSAVSGAYAGAVSTYPAFPGQPWPNNFQPSYAIGEVHTRTSVPTFGGDLLYVGPLGLSSGPGSFIFKPAVNVINTATHQMVEQIVPPASVTQIYDFTLGPGALGSKSRAYLNTNSGLFAFNEVEMGSFIGFDPITHQLIFDQSHFQLVSPMPLLTTFSPSASFDISPTDGFLYVIDGVGSASSIKRYNTTTGALIDTFLTFAQYNYGNAVGKNLKFGPDGALYLSSSVPPFVNPRLVISRFDASTGLRSNDFDLGPRSTDDFYIVPTTPEPSTLILAVAAFALVPWRSRAC